MTVAPKFTELASIISDNAAKIEEYLTSSDSIPRPSFAPGGPPFFPAPPDATHVQAARETLLDAARKLTRLALGPTEALTELASRSHDLSALHAIYSFDIAPKVPLEGEISFADVGKAVGLDEDRVTRVIRTVIPSGVFKETRPGFIAHTSISALLTSNSGIVDVFGLLIDESFPASTHFVESLRKWPEPKNPQVETPFALLRKTDVPFYEWLGGYPERLERFHRAMKANDAGGYFSSSSLTHGYDWNSFNAKVLVDIGGSLGHATMRIANGSNIPKFIVQDINPDELSGARAALPKEYDGRIEFQEHDFFKPNPAKDADIYFLRWILHNWPDAECIQILKAIVPALKRGARILVSDIVLPEPNAVFDRLHREMRVCDIYMLTVFGSRERDVGMFRRLFEAADPRFKFIGVSPIAESALSMVEAVWDP